jgi:hypothetical protein
VVRVIVVGAGSQHDISAPLPDLATDLAAHFQRGQQLAVVIVQNFIFDSNPSLRFLSFRAPTFGQHPATLLVVSGVAVRNGDEFHQMPGRSVFRGQPSGLGVAVVRMSAECDDAQPGIILARKRNCH